MSNNEHITHHFVYHLSDFLV